MKKPIVNFGQSIRTRLLAISRRENVQHEYVLLRYAFERFLFRLGKSAYAEKFILKGASAFAVWLGPMVRVTRDADLEAFGDSSPNGLIAAFKEICLVECREDGVEFDRDSFKAEEIKKEDKYPGVRITFSAVIGGARADLQFDVGFGDSVYPEAERMNYPVLLGHEAPVIRVYPRYTTVAEKFHTMVDRGILNSRLKDYYDIWLLSGRFGFDAELLRTAMERTFKRRGTEMSTSLPDGVSESFSGNPTKQLQWKAFLKKVGGPELSLGAVSESIAKFLGPILENPGIDGQVWDKDLKQWTSCGRK